MSLLTAAGTVNSVHGYTLYNIRTLDVAKAIDHFIYSLIAVSFSSVPKVSPSLGLKVGHDRRDIAAARKPRPPTRKNATAIQQQVCKC